MLKINLFRQRLLNQLAALERDVSHLSEQKPDSPDNAPLTDVKYSGVGEGSIQTTNRKRGDFFQTWARQPEGYGDVGKGLTAELQRLRQELVAEREKKQKEHTPGQNRLHSTEQVVNAQKKQLDEKEEMLKKQAEILTALREEKEKLNKQLLIKEEEVVDLRAQLVRLQEMWKESKG